MRERARLGSEEWGKEVLGGDLALLLAAQRRLAQLFVEQHRRDLGFSARLSKV